MKLRLVVGAALVAAAGVATPLVAFGGGGGGQSVTVKLRDYAILSAALKPAVFGKASPLQAGPTTFTFTNTGKFTHNFTVIRTSPGGTKFKTPDIAPGKSVTLTVNLKPGSYLAICTIFNGFHAAAGMVKSFSVGTIDAQGKWQAGPTTASGGGSSGGTTTTSGTTTSGTTTYGTTTSGY